MADKTVKYGFDWPTPRSTCSFIGTTAAILAGTLATAGASVASGVIGSKAAKSAAKTQSDAATRSMDLQREQFNRTQENLSPWLTTGRDALGQLKDLMAPGGRLSEEYRPFGQEDVQSEFDPGFAYRMKQSNDALQAWAASRGGLLSGGTGQKLIRNAQEMGSQEYQAANQRALQKYTTNRDTFYQDRANQYNRLSSLSNMGESAAGAIGNAGQQYALSASGENDAAAAATAAGGVGASNAWTNSLGNIAGAFSQYAILNKLLGTDSGTLGKIQGGYAPNLPSIPASPIKPNIPPIPPIGLQPNYAR